MKPSWGSSDFHTKTVLCPLLRQQFHRLQSIHHKNYTTSPAPGETIVMSQTMHDNPMTYERMKLWTVKVLSFCSGLSQKLGPYVSPLSYVWGVQPCHFVPKCNHEVSLKLKVLYLTFCGLVKQRRIALPCEAITSANQK